jgi:hypothetical protein
LAALPASLVAVGTKPCLATVTRLFRDSFITNSVAWVRKRTVLTDWATAACRRS